MRRRNRSFLAAGVVILAACGSPSATEPAAQPAPGETTATTEPGIAPPETTAPQSGSTDATNPPASAATDPPATDTGTQPPAPDTARPDDGCSEDNSPTPTDVQAGPLPAVEVRAESADSPLPDLAVRRINCAGGWVNLKNELPSDKPLLVWFWAPH